MLKKRNGKKRASGSHRGRDQPAAKRLSKPNSRSQHEPSSEPAAPGPVPPPLRPKRLTLLDLKAMSQPELKTAAFEAGLLAGVPKQPKSGKILKEDLLAALTKHIQIARPGKYLLDMLSPVHSSSRERATLSVPKSKPKVGVTAHAPPCVCHVPLARPDRVYRTLTVPLRGSIDKMSDSDT